MFKGFGNEKDVGDGMVVYKDGRVKGRFLRWGDDSGFKRR